MALRILKFPYAPTIAMPRGSRVLGAIGVGAGVEIVALGDPQGISEPRALRIFTIGETVPDTIGQFICQVSGPIQGFLFESN